MISQVRKRDGKYVSFDRDKIKRAILNANNSVAQKERIGIKTIEEIVDEISNFNQRTVGVEVIQDYIEDKLMKLEKYELAKSYIKYRFKRKLVRESNTTDESILALIKNKNDEVGSENSNKNPKLISTQRDLIAGEVSKDIAKRFLLPKEITKAHEEGLIHLHDMDYFMQDMFNCCLVNIGDMLDNGTIINGKMIETPKSFQVACTIVSQIIASVASSQYGGQSINVKHLGKYLRRSKNKFYENIKETLTKSGVDNEKLLNELVNERLSNELKQGIQTLQYQINTLMTTNGQSPFVTLFLHIEDGYEYEKEVAMIIEEILRQRIKGIKNDIGVYVTPAFPKLVYVLDTNNNLTGGKYDYLTKIAAECTTKRMYPDYISAKKMRENYEGNVFSPMGCRSFLSPYKDKDGNYIFEGRFNMGVVSLNLPHVALMSKDISDFYVKLDESLELCKKALMCRYEKLKGVKSDVSPIHWQNGAIARLKKGETIDNLLEDGYATISLGYIGIYETVKILLGESNTSEKASKLAFDILNHLKDTVNKWKEETHIGFGLYGTPSESLCHRFAKLDKKTFGDIQDITDKDYYTNSFHVDVRENIDAFSKFKFESPFQDISSGGCISYVEIPNLTNNVEALEELIKFIYDNIQYAEFNTKTDVCHVCLYDGEMKVNENNTWYCPNCGNNDHSKLTVVRRTCGYLGENFWNEGKTKEISKRVLHL